MRQDATPAPRPADSGETTRVFLYLMTLAGTVLIELVFAVAFGGLPLGPLIPALTAVVLVAMARWAVPGDSARFRELVLASGLAVFLMLRPLADGLTFPHLNVPMLWGVAALTLWWASGALLRREAPGIPAGTLLLAGFLAVALLACIGSIQLEASLRSVLIWAGCLLLFCAASGGLRTPLGIGLVLGAFVASIFAEAWYGVVHLNYLLPASRAFLNQNPHLLMTGMGVSEMNDQLLDRLHSTRAFGHFIMANALAGYLVLGIPLCLAGLVSRLGTFRQAWKHRSETAPAPAPRARGGAMTQEMEEPVSTGVAAWLASLAVCFVLFYFYYYRARYPGLPWTAHFLPWLGVVGVLPVLFGVATHFVSKRGGMPCVSPAAQVAGFTIVLGQALYALFLTFSRGGMLALIVALAVAGLVLLTGKRRAAFSTAVIVLALLLPVPAMLGAAPPADAGPAGATAGPPPAASNLARGETVRMRLDYWRVGMRMASDHWLTGVGPGAFGAAYPAYQRPGEHPVQQAHNDYLQVFCETGIFGLMFFAGFWAWFILVGLRRVLAVPDPARRLLALGLWSSLLAFLFHAFVDFNFVNPSLCMPALTLAGVLFALTRTQPASAVRPHHRIAVAACAGLALLMTAATLPMRQIDAFTADIPAANTRFMAVEFFLAECNPAKPEADSMRRIPHAIIRPFIPSRAVLESFGRFMTPRADNPALFRPLGEGEPLTGFEDFVVTDRKQAYEAAREAVNFWIERTEAVDAQFPWSVELARQLYHWHELMLVHETDEEKALPWLDGTLRWAEIAANRSPMQAVVRELHARALWRKAGSKQGAEAQRLYRESIEAFRKCVELYPASPEFRTELADRLEEYARGLEEAGLAEAAAPLLREAEAVRAEAAGLPPL